ncbi:MAG: hypothetical protein M3247_08920 [Thermoproteota archaeon]|nr:hypothetical protein [Thermoproteota archaeon]
MANDVNNNNNSFGSKAVAEGRTAVGLKGWRYLRAKQLEEQQHKSKSITGIFRTADEYMQARDELNEEVFDIMRSRTGLISYEDARKVAKKQHLQEFYRLVRDFYYSETPEGIDQMRAAKESFSQNEQVTIDMVSQAIEELYRNEVIGVLPDSLRKEFEEEEAQKQKH